LLIDSFDISFFQYAVFLANYYPVFVDGTSGNIPPNVGTGLTFNPNTSLLTVGGNVNANGINSTSARNTGWSSGSNWLFISMPSARTFASGTSLTTISFIGGTIKGDTSSFTSILLSTNGQFAPSHSGVYNINLNMNIVASNNNGNLTVGIYTTGPTLVGTASQFYTFQRQSTMTNYGFSGSVSFIVPLANATPYFAAYTPSVSVANYRCSICIHQLM
jgi:hypothetical protein